MRLRYINRSFLWIGKISITLFSFWWKNPKETPSVLFFIATKLLESPKFLYRNILLEKRLLSFKNSVSKTTKIYNKIGKKFDPFKASSYALVQPYLFNKFQILYFIVRKLKPKIVIETGVATGESTSYILKALKDNRLGKLYSIDLPFQWYIYGSRILHMDSLPPGTMPGYLVPEDLKRNWQLIIGNTYDKLPMLLKKVGTIDIFFHDSEHTDQTMKFEYEISWPHIKRGGLLISDDTDCSDAFYKFSKKVKTKKIYFKEVGIITK